MAEKAPVGGLAGKVRRANNSDEFDLQNFSQSQCNDLAKNAFVDPFELTEMVRLSFVCGGGREVRQKYSDALPKQFMIALDGIGFNQDDAASLELQSGGSYKYQHDTGKNLKFVHVYPRVVVPAGGAAVEEDEDGVPIRGPREPAVVLAECSIDEFRRLFADRVGGYAARKRLLDIMKERVAKADAAEQKMIARQDLDAEEQDIYSNSIELQEKLKIITTDLQALIDGCQLNAAEKSQVLEQLEATLVKLQAEIVKAEADGKEKRQKTLEEQRDKMKATKTAVADSAPKGRPALRYAAEIRRLRGKIAQILKLEKGGSQAGGKYTLDELNRLGEKPEIEEALAELERRCRMWFESDEEFALRIQDCLRAAPGAAAPKSRPASRQDDGFSVVKGKKR